jgi:LDH2 family malate/lactate/ureidoglycolate dehydrogenase
MNKPPIDGIRVVVEVLQRFVQEIFAAVPIADDAAELIAAKIIDTDLRGVVSHGVAQVERYVNDYLNAKTNTDPTIKVLREGPTTAALSGDGGLGIVVANQAMEMAIAKAKAYGVGVVTTTYHEHIGSAGKYVRMAMRQDLIGAGFSGRNAAHEYDPDACIRGSIQGSPPMAFGMPATQGQPYFMLDMSTGMPWDEQCFKKMPEVYFRGLGICHVANIMSGTLGGQMLEEFDRRTIQYAAANQSGCFMAIDIACFVPLEAFKKDMDHLLDATGKMQPYPGYDKAYLPGGPEWQCEQEYTRDGIPVSATTMESLAGVAARLGVAVPW